MPHNYPNVEMPPLYYSAIIKHYHAKITTICNKTTTHHHQHYFPRTTISKKHKHDNSHVKQHSKPHDSKNAIIQTPRTVKNSINTPSKT
mmetsp:Transcript_17848/g.27880  ORF Transcript_17848/g.27880 Transcript_17848/m.27880 type:complete len:89 (+) Transcript_17848:178-444(+)